MPCCFVCRAAWTANAFGARFGIADIACRQDHLDLALALRLAAPAWELIGYYFLVPRRVLTSSMYEKNAFVSGVGLAGMRIRHDIVRR
mmetsp:Transcript_48769/g.123105  ORF Transcript_48769/g.123105 Transcript_48769/m.123105 type:complete len:88 (-) Transcript_48769:247-510(-)